MSMSENPVDPAALDDRGPFFERLGLNSETGVRHMWRVVVPVALAACSAAILLTLGLSQLSRDQNDANAAVTHALTVLERTALLEGNIADTVAEGRGFLLDPVPERRAHVEADFAAVHEGVLLWLP